AYQDIRIPTVMSCISIKPDNPLHVWYSSAIAYCARWLTWLYQWWQIKKRRQNSGETSHVSTRWEEDYALAEWGPTHLFFEYLEMILQFGFVTIFVAAFPLAPLFALLNNILEIRLDARKLVCSYRRPVGVRVQNIGIWFRIMDSIGKLAVLTNV
ncbi:anoctamin-4-like, partial [Stegodyphus dumicola]|uniref:anoctamin-4-like n=1 Tax=Stegodyphus dumicola TaxID=202533 RepID=UPI0015B2FD1C